MARANRLLLKSSLDSQFATLVVGKATADGEIETVNAGHLPPLLSKGGVKGELDLAGLPLGMFCEAEFASQKVKLDGGDSLVLFTDGVTETVDADGVEFGTERLSEAINGSSFTGPRDLITRCVDHVTSYRGGGERRDDLTMLALSFV
jgi:sigma-B regulation protein RsbU (phosphoserine phosphatase)